MRVAGLDIGTVGVDCCRLDDGRAGVHRSWDTAALLARPSLLREALEGAEYLAIAAGYGAPLTELARADARTIALALLADPRAAGGGIGGLRRLFDAIDACGVRAVLLPSVVLLPTVPRHRKLNRIDLGTADKVAVAALAAAMHGPHLNAIVVELGGAFTAALAMEDGRIVDGIGGSAGPIGARASGALDGEVAMLADHVSKQMIFGGGRADAAALLGEADARLAWVEAAAKAVGMLRVSAPRAERVLVSGRGGEEPGVVAQLAALVPDLPVHALRGLPAMDHVKTGAQGAAVLADGLLGGTFAPVVEQLRLREASGSVLDHLVVVSPADAARRLGLS